MDKHEVAGAFSDWTDILRAFDLEFKDQPKEPEFLFAYYDIDGYEGYAKVIYSYDGSIFYVTGGSHCSCYGLEDQWDPTEHSVAELVKMFSHEKRLMTWLVDSRFVDNA